MVVVVVVVVEVSDKVVTVLSDETLVDKECVAAEEDSSREVVEST